MKRRISALLLALVMTVGLLPRTAWAAEGDITISSVDDLKALATAVNGGNSYEGKTVTLTADLDLGGENWTPIGTDSKPFKGTFDGGFHTIHNLTINTTSRYCGLFGKLQNATIQNLGIENANVASSANDAAALAGNAQGGTISRCYVTGTVKGGGAVSGILGSTHSRSYTTRIDNCYARVAIVQNGTYTDDLAGISGWNEATSVAITNSYSACTGEKRPIAGWSDGSAVTNSQFVNTYFDKTLSPDFSESSGRADLGKTSTELKTQGTFTGWDFSAIWAIDPEKNGGYPYLRGFTPGLGGAPGSVTVRVVDGQSAPVTDASVAIKLDTANISLSHEGNGVYSGVVTTSGDTYDVYVNGQKVGSVTQTGSGAASVTMTAPAGGTPIPGHTHAVSEGGEAVTWTAWDGSGEITYTNSTASVYLTQDVRKNANISVPAGKTLNLCLNGFTVSGNVTSGLFSVAKGGELHICDCSESRTGKIYCGDSIGSMGVFNQGVFVLESGTVAGEGTNSAGVYNYSTCIINDGTVTGRYGICNIASGNQIKTFIKGGTVTGTAEYGVYSDDSGVELYLSGAPTITGAKADIYTEASTSNICADNGAETPTPYSGKVLSLGYPSPLTAGSQVVRRVTQATKDKFKLVDQSYGLTWNQTDQTLVITASAQPAHSHAVSVGCETDSGTQVTFLPLTVNGASTLCVDGAALTPNQYGTYTLPAGSYYLPDDITLNASINIQDAASAPVNLCLNGHTLDLGEGRIDIKATYNNGNGVLNICDCGATGKVTSAYSGGSTNSATVQASGQFSLYGGTVENTSTAARNNHAVGFLDGTANLYGGTLVSQSDSGLWVSCWQADSLTLSGAVTIQGGADKADVYFDPSSTWERNTHFTLTGPLSKPQTPWRVEVEDGKPMPLVSGWSTYMDGADFDDYFRSATQGVFVGRREKGDLELARCAITQQPSAENSYTVTANGAPASAPTYQWYSATVTTAEVTTENATVYSGGPGSQPSSFADGKWTAPQSSHDSPGYFTMSLKRGDKVSVTLATAEKPSGGQMGLVRDYNEPGEYVQVWYPFDGNTERYSYVGTAAEDGGNTVITYVIPADGSYDLTIDGLYGSDQAAPVITATRTYAVLGEALTGQTTARLTATTAGNYLCRVSWADGTTVDSNVVAYTPPAHEHNWAPGWSHDATHHWHECAAEGCDVTAYSGKDGYAEHTKTWASIDAAQHQWSCSVCGRRSVESAHTWNDGVVTTPPTVDAEGVRTYTCTACQATKTEAVPKLKSAYDISGAVKDHENNAVEGATVRLMKGNTQVAGPVRTDASGTYTFTGVAPGSYNVVATKDDKTMTILVLVTNADLAEQNLSMPGENVNSVLDVKDTTVSAAAADVAKAVVGGLDKVAEKVKTDNGTATSVTVTMTVEAREESAAANAGAIQAAATGKTLEYLDIKVEQKIDSGDPQPVTDTGDTVIEIVVPFRFSGKVADSVTVYRYHGDSAAALDKADTKAGGTFLLDTAGGLIHIYATKFSTYAIGYTLQVEEPPTPPSRPYEPPVSVSPAEPEKKECPRDGTCPLSAFPDADPDSELHDALHYCVEQGLFRGYDDGLLRPEEGLTRGMMVELLYNAAGRPQVAGTGGFVDVTEEDWYAPAAAWAAQAGVVKGFEDGRFAADVLITREQIIVMIYRYATYAELLVPPAPAKESGAEAQEGKNQLPPELADMASASWAYDAIVWAINAGLLELAEDNDLTAPITREQAAVILHGYLLHLSGK